jgi:tetratricopeptide (TPR) repeat protein
MFAGELELTNRRSATFGSAEFQQTVASAVERFERLGDSKGLAYASRIAAWERWASLRFAESIEKFEAEADHAARAGIRYLEDEAHARIARAHASGPTPVSESIRFLEELAREQAERPLALAGIQGALARALAIRGEIAAARELQDAEEIYLEAGMVLEATSGRWTKAIVARCAGDLEEEERLMWEMTEILEKLGDRTYLSTHLMQLGLCLVERGKDDEAWQALERAQEVTSVDDIADVVGLGVLEAVLRARRGDLEEAQELASQALARVEETDHVGMRLATRWNAAEVFELAGRGDEAKALLAESVEIAERYGHLVAAQQARNRLAKEGAFE